MMMMLKVIIIVFVRNQDQKSKAQKYYSCNKGSLVGTWVYIIQYHTPGEEGHLQLVEVEVNGIKYSELTPYVL